jgi:ankyrin repeat protein
MSASRQRPASQSGRHRQRRRFAAPSGLLAAVLLATSSLAQVAPSAREQAAYTGLHQAAQKGDAAAIATLAGAGAPLEAVDGNGRTPLHVATFARQHEAIRALAARGARLGALDADRYDAVTIAAVADDEATLALLLALGAKPGQITSRYDGNALIAAAHLGHDGVVRRLINAGAPLNHFNNLHWTAVIEAIVLGDGGPRHQATLKALIDAGADLRLTDRQGATPLALARARGFREMIAMLEAGGGR